jgi:hypothetical protein
VPHELPLHPAPFKRDAPALRVSQLAAPLPECLLLRPGPISEDTYPPDLTRREGAGGEPQQHAQSEGQDRDGT